MSPLKCPPPHQMGVGDSHLGIRVVGKSCPKVYQRVNRGKVGVDAMTLMLGVSQLSQGGTQGGVAVKGNTGTQKLHVLTGKLSAQSSPQKKPKHFKKGLESNCSSTSTTSLENARSTEKHTESLVRDCAKHGCIHSNKHQCLNQRNKNQHNRGVTMG